MSRLAPAAGLYGRRAFETALVEQWLDVCSSELEPIRAELLRPAKGKGGASNVTVVEQDAAELLAFLDAHLLEATYFVGNTLTLADIAFAVALEEVFAKVRQATHAGGGWWQC